MIALTRPNLPKTKLLRQAADLAEDPGFANYLRLRADALVTDDFQPSDMAESFTAQGEKRDPVFQELMPIPTKFDDL